MSEQHTIPESPGTAVPGSLAPGGVPAPSDVSTQIAQLTNAVNRLVQAQQTSRARLSPVQQIAMGLRDAKPVGPAHPRAVQAAGAAQAVNPDARPVGAD